MKSIFKFLLPLATFCITQTIAAPQYPFPQQIKYKYGNTATYADPAVIKQHFNDWKSAWYEDMNNGTARIISPNDSAEMTVSEGIAYGMMLMVYMSDAQNNYKTEFDKLWAYWKKYAGGQAAGMNWHVNNKNGNADNGSATDADVDAAFALVMANAQWGDATYLTEANQLISWIKSHDMETDGRVRAGSNWNPALNSSYVIPAAFKLFGAVTNDTFWDTAINVNIKHIQQCQNATSGLMPDWCDWSSHKATNNTGAAVSGGSGGFFDDAARTPWRMAMAYNWYGIDGAKQVNDKIMPWLDKSTYGNANFIWPGYSLDGSSSPYAMFVTSTYAGGLGLAAGSAENSDNYLESVYTVLANMEGAKAPGSGKGEKYYPATLNILCLLSMSGNMPNLYDMANAQKYTQTTVRVPQEPTGTLMPKNSGASFWGYENWGTFADKFGVTIMKPDTGSTGIYLQTDGSYIVEAQMRIAPEPTYEANVDLQYPFAGVALSFDSLDSYYDLSEVATIKMTYASQGVIRFAILDKQTILDQNEGGEAGYFLHPTTELTTISLDVTQNGFGSSYEDYMKDKFVSPDWTGGTSSRDDIMKSVRGFKFEPKMQKGGFGSITITSFELLDANGTVITKFTNGNLDAINFKHVIGAKFAKIQGKNIVYNNMPKNATMRIFDMNGNTVKLLKLGTNGIIPLETIVHAKGSYIATIKGNNYIQQLKLQK